MANQPSETEKALAGLGAADLERLVARIDAIPLFAHAYAHHLNLRFGALGPDDLLLFATAHGLAGLSIHVDDGEARSLARMPDAGRAAFGARARQLGLALHVETSSTEFAELGRAAAIARAVGARSIRCYPRYAGRVSEILARTVGDLRRLDEIDPERRFRFTLEQHEDLRAAELVAIVTAVGSNRLRLLFDFGNMVNAGEAPLDALEIMAPFVSEVHVKDVRIEPDRGGSAQCACRSGEGDLPMHRLLGHLLRLGDAAPQVTAFALQEEIGMRSPALRFPNDPDDPFVAMRPASFTEPPAAHRLEAGLAGERADARRQVDYVRAVLADLRHGAAARLAASAFP